MFNQTTLHMRILNTTVNSAMKWLTYAPDSASNLIESCNRNRNSRSPQSTPFNGLFYKVLRAQAQSQLGYRHSWS